MSLSDSDVEGWTQLHNNIFVSSFEVASNVSKYHSFYETYGIKCVINMAREIGISSNQMVYYRQNQIQYFRFPLDDIDVAIPKETFEAIVKNYKRVPTLIHCHAGVNRSAVMAVAIFCKYENIYNLHPVILIEKMRLQSRKYFDENGKVKQRMVPFLMNLPFERSVVRWCLGD